MCLRQRRLQRGERRGGGGALWAHAALPGGRAHALPARGVPFPSPPVHCLLHKSTMHVQQNAILGTQDVRCFHDMVIVSRTLAGCAVRAAAPWACTDCGRNGRWQNGAGHRAHGLLPGECIKPGCCMCTCNLIYRLSQRGPWSGPLQLGLPTRGTATWGCLGATDWKELISLHPTGCSRA